MANNFLKQEEKTNPQVVSNLSMASKNYIDEEAKKNRRYSRTEGRRKSIQINNEKFINFIKTKIETAANKVDAEG